MMMRRLTANLAILALALCLGACVSVELGGGQDRRVGYLLADAQTDMPSRSTPLPTTLVLQILSGDPLANSQAMAFATAPGQREQYQLAYWVQRPVQALPRLLLNRLQTRGAFEGVALLGDGITGTLALGIGIDTLYHDATTAPGAVELGLRADLVDRQTRRLLARRNFKASTPLTQAGPDYVAVATGEAVAMVFDALVPWLEAEAAKALTLPAVQSPTP